MKIELSDVLAVAALGASIIGFYCVGRYHEEHLREKEEAKKAAEEKPTSSDDENL